MQAGKSMPALGLVTKKTTFSFNTLYKISSCLWHLWEFGNITPKTWFLIQLYWHVCTKCQPMPQHLSSIKIKTPKATRDQVLKVFRDAQSLLNEKVSSYQERPVGMNHILITTFSVSCLNAPCSNIYRKTKCLRNQKLLHPIAEDIL